MLVWKCDMCKREMESEDDLFEISLIKGNTQKITTNQRWCKMLDMSSEKKYEMCPRCTRVLFSALDRGEQ